MKVPNHVLIFLSDNIEVEAHHNWFEIAPPENVVSIMVARVWTYELNFKFRMVMCIGSPLEGATFLGVACNRSGVRIGYCHDDTGWSRVLVGCCHSKARSQGKLQD